MFNASAYNAAGFNARSGGIRVILAAATITAGALASADGYKVGAGAAEAAVQSSLSADRFRYTKGAAHADVTALMDAGRPYDLASAVLGSVASARADGYAIRAGAGDGSVTSRMEAPAIRYAFFADMGASASVKASALAYRFAGTDVAAESGMDAGAVREHAGSAEILAGADARADGLVYAGGITRLEPESDLHAEAHLNGIQTAGSIMGALAEAQADPVRMAGGGSVGDVSLTMTAAPVPGRGASVDEGSVTADMAAVWWTFIGADSDTTAEAELAADASTIYACRAFGATSASLIADWNIIVEPKGIALSGHAEISAEPWRGRPVTSEGVVLSEMIADPVRIRFVAAEVAAGAESLRARASVNLTNAAPEWRQMIVPAKATAMTAPYENRAMTVT